MYNLQIKDVNNIWVSLGMFSNTVEISRYLYSHVAPFIKDSIPCRYISNNNDGWVSFVVNPK